MQVSLFVTIYLQSPPNGNATCACKIPFWKLIHLCRAISPCLWGPITNQSLHFPLQSCTPAGSSFLSIHVELMSESWIGFPFLMHGITQDRLTLGLCDPTPIQFLEGGCNLFQKNVKDLRTKVCHGGCTQIQAFELTHVGLWDRWGKSDSVSYHLVTAGWAKGVLGHLGRKQAIRSEKSGWQLS